MYRGVRAHPVSDMFCVISRAGLAFSGVVKGGQRAIPEKIGWR